MPGRTTTGRNLLNAKFSSGLLALAAIILAGAPIRGDLLRAEAGKGPEPSPSASPAAETAPAFDLPNFSGGRVRLSDYRGQVVLINFWTTWCPPCRKEIPDFVELYRNYQDRGLVILGISLDRNPDQVLGSFIDKFKINYPILLDDGKVARNYGGITAIPTSFIVDREGIIRNHYVGLRPKRVFEEAIKELL